VNFNKKRENECTGLFSSNAAGAAPSKNKKMSEAKIEREPLHTDDAPAAVGPYSQAVRVDRTIYISGQIGFDPATMKCVEGGVEAETHQVLKNMGAILKNAGCDYSNVVKTTVLVQSMDDFAKVNAVYAQYFNEPYPARACFEVARLPKDVNVEIEAIAVKGPFA
jgi:2-iminobutanoate/2-iminopropanoate deaminase